jgi:hypothetical protein
LLLWLWVDFELPLCDPLPDAVPWDPVPCDPLPVCAATPTASAATNIELVKKCRLIG